MKMIWILLLSLLFCGPATAEIVKINTKHLSPKQVEQLYKLQKKAHNHAIFQKESARVLPKPKTKTRVAPPPKTPEPTVENKIPAEKENR